MGRCILCPGVDTLSRISMGSNGGACAFSLDATRGAGASSGNDRSAAAAAAIGGNGARVRLTAFSNFCRGLAVIRLTSAGSSDGGNSPILAIACGCSSSNSASAMDCCGSSDGHCITIIGNEITNRTCRSGIGATIGRTSDISTGGSRWSLDWVCSFAPRLFDSNIFYQMCMCGRGPLWGFERCVTVQWFL